MSMSKNLIQFAIGFGDFDPTAKQLFYMWTTLLLWLFATGTYVK